MKKSLLLAVMAIAALTASAGIERETFVASPCDGISNEPLTVVTTTATTTAINKLPLVGSGSEDIEGFYQMCSVVNYGSSYSAYNDQVQQAESIEIEKTDDGYIVKGLYQPFMTDEVNALNATFADGKLTIPAGQTLSTHATYGKIIVAHASDYTSQGFVAKDIVFDYDAAAGTLTLSSGQGLIRGIPEYSTGNYSLTPYLSTASIVMTKCNATIKQYNENDEVIYDGHAVVTPMDGGYHVEGYFDAFFTFIVSNGEVTVNQEPAALSTSKISSGYGFGYPCKAQYNVEKASWYYYTSTTSPVGLAYVTGTLEGDNDCGKITLIGSTIISKNTSGSGGLRFADYTSKTELAWSDIPSAVNDVNASKSVKSVEYVNLNGQVSSSAFEGINIVVTNYTDGSRTATKVVK